MGKYFGTDGVRGKANEFLTPELAFNLGRAGAYVLTKNQKTAPKIIVASDSRQSGDMLQAALTAGLCSIGATVYHAGVLPTPAVACLVKKYSLNAGVMISASHNPMEDNGIKFFNNEGYKLPDSLENEIERIIDDILSGKDTLPRPTGVNVGTVVSSKNTLQDYADFLTNIVPNLSLKGYKVVLDCANGATSKIAPFVFQQLGAELHVLSNEPDGTNINKNCGSTHMENLQAKVKELSADVGFAFDGDGDRALAVDEKGEIVDGDKILAICGLEMFKNKELDTIVATVMSNQGFESFCNKNGIKLFRTDVGDRYVLEKMLEDNLPLGGEQSGHVIFKNHNTTGDGLLTVLKLAEIMVEKKKPISTLTSVMETYPQILVNTVVPNERKSELFTNEKIKKAQEEIVAKMAGDGRILIRPSGTEPLVRVMIEGKNKENIEAWAVELADLIGSVLNC